VLCGILSGATAVWPQPLPSATRGITACIPSTRSRKVPIPHDATLYRKRHRIEIMFGRLKDWRRIATRDDRCATIFLGAITLAAIVIFWLGQ
jgi:transposase